MPVDEARLLEGKVLAAKFQDDIRQAVADFAKRGLAQPCLAGIHVATDGGSEWYLGQQEKMAAKLGIRYERPYKPVEFTSQETLIAKILETSARRDVHGIFLTMPLPGGFDADSALFALDPVKDVEGIHPASLGLIVLRKTKCIPSTAYAALQLAEHAVKEAGKNLKGMKAVIVGQSAIVGRPLQMLLGERRVTTTVCNTGTTAVDLEKAVAESDLVVACAGQPGLVKGAWVKPGAIVIDVGTTEVNGKLAGDVEFEEAKKRAGFITPVPGGVGPLTVTMLMQNLIRAYREQHGLG